MKKFTKILALTLAIVMLCTVLSACSLIGSDLARYRSVVAFTVGDEEVTIGNVLDAYSTNYYNYYTYISYGYMTTDEVFENTMTELFEKYTMLADYKSDDSSVIYTSSENSYISLGMANMEYLTQSEAEFAMLNIKYSVFTSLDSYVEDYITTEIGELGDIAEDTSRDFTEYDDFGEYETYNDYQYYKALDTTDMEEYFADYYSVSGFDQYSLSVADYVFASEADAQAKVDYINECLEEATEDGDEVLSITAEDYIAWQELAVEKFDTVLDASYGTGYESYMVEQAGNTVISIIASKWSLGITAEVESDQEALTAALSAEFEAKQDAYLTSINQNEDSYISFITSLSDSSYIFGVPASYEDDFIFVKNILVSFSDAQSAQLSNLSTILGGTDSAEYIAYREALAADIVATDYYNDEAEVESLFVLDSNGNIALNDSADDSTLYDTLTSADLDDESFMDLMGQYNEDTASHTSTYDYVVYVGAPATYTHSWVDEFVDAAVEAYNAGEGSYSLCVSDYGVHIVYYSSDIEIWDSFDSNKMYETTSNEYQLLVSYYSTQSTILYTDAGDALDEIYRYGGLIVEGKGMDYLLEETGMEYDFDEAITSEDE